MTPPSKTNWPLVALAVGAGMAASFQIGKVPPSLPVLREAFALDMVGAGWVASLFSGTAALFGIAAGAIADSVGRRRTLLLALLIMVVGSLGATFATSPATLYASRFAEGLGFLLAVVAGPSVVAETAAPKDMRLALSFWGTYMPVGMALAMIGAPHLIAMGGWNGLWYVSAALVLGVFLLLAVSLRGAPASAPPVRRLGDFTEALRPAGPWILAGIFIFYSFQWFIIMTWLPSFVIEQLGLDAQLAALLAAIAVIGNMPGTLIGGWLMGKGLKRHHALAIASVTMGVMGQICFLEWVPPVLRYGAVLVFSLVGGLIPVSVFSGVVAHAARPQFVGIVNGMVVQGSNIGSFFGPPVYALLVGLLGGWQQGGVVLGAAAAAMLAFAVAIGRVEAKR